MRSLASLCLVAAISALGPAVASAQMSFSFDPLNGRTGSVSARDTYLTFEPISAAECTADTLDLNMTNITAEPVGTSYTLSVWRTTTLTENCTAAGSRYLRTGTPPTPARPCVNIGVSQDVMTPTDTLSIPISSLFDSCTSTSGTTAYCILVMTNAEDITSVAVASACFQARLDVTPPSRATLAATAGGETNATVTITDRGTADDLRGYRICTGGTCGSGGSSDGGGSDGGTGSIGIEDCAMTVVASTSPANFSVNVTDLVLGGAGKEVAIILVDRAGNESPISTVSCVSRVNVDGFWDRYCAENGFADDPEGCRAHYSSCSCRTVGRGASAIPALGAFFAVALALVVRRKR